MAISTVVLVLFLAGVADGEPIEILRFLTLFVCTCVCSDMCVIRVNTIADAMYTSSRKLNLSHSAVSDGFVRNFRIVSNNGTHVRFSWDIQSGYESTSNITSFWIYYAYAYPGHSISNYNSYANISPSSTTQTNGGLTFSYTTTVTRFSNVAQYIIWLRVDRSTTPTELYSEQIYVEIGERESASSGVVIFKDTDLMV